MTPPRNRAALAGAKRAISASRRATARAAAPLTPDALLKIRRALARRQLSIGRPDPELRIRVVNVVDLMKLQPDTVHPNGLSDDAFDALFTRYRPVIFAFHGYPVLIHRLTYRRINHDNLHVHGFIEEGTTTTPFDMTVRNGLDRFHLVADVIGRVPSLGTRAVGLVQLMADKRVAHKQYIEEHGEDMPEIRDWRWPE